MRTWVLFGLIVMLLTACASAHRTPDTMFDNQTMVEYLNWIGLTAPPPSGSKSECAEPIHGAITISNGVNMGMYMGICCADGLVWSYRSDRGWHQPTEEEMVIWNRACAVGMSNPCKK